MKKRVLVVVFAILCMLIYGGVCCVKDIEKNIGKEEGSNQTHIKVTVGTITQKPVFMPTSTVAPELIIPDVQDMLQEEMPNENTQAFIRVDGVKLVDENGDEFRIKGMCFGNNVWAEPSEPVLTHHDEASYAELAELGFNSVRFYLNYNLFEDDDAPYEYKESGFEWLDQNIMWAKKHGIKLILNMHVPQGGFLSASQVTFWEKKQNVERYMALWCEIAERYSEEPIILGYGLMNEPFVPEMDTADEALGLYYDTIDVLIEKIRKVDNNHILFVERPYGMVDKNGAVDYAWGDVGASRLLKDKNVVYEFHFYEKTQFTSQGISWREFEKDWYYGDDRIALLSGKRDYFGTVYKQSMQDYRMISGGWQYMESPLLDMSEYPEANAAYMLAVFSGLSGKTAIYVDDIVVEEYDSNNIKIRTLYQATFDTEVQCNSWQTGNGPKGTCMYLKDEGHNEDGCEVILGAGGTFCLYKSGSLYDYFPVQPGNKYKISFWMKAKGWDKVIVKPGLQLVAVEKVESLNKEYLERKLLTYIGWGEAQGVPIYIGEYGTSSYIMGNEYGGEKWVSDVTDIFNKYQLNYSYHDYHEEAYGLYTTAPTKERDKKNQVLYQVFKEKVKE